MRTHVLCIHRAYARGLCGAVAPGGGGGGGAPNMQVPPDPINSHYATAGNPSNKRRWREMLNEDGDEIGQTEVFNKTLKRG